MWKTRKLRKTGFYIFFPNFTQGSTYAREIYRGFL